VDSNSPALADALQAVPNNGMNLIGDQYGRQITGNGLTALIKRAVAAAGLPALCVE
jgi:hypothetical protein